ncbi:hypothetical protein FKM82_020361 [Ascaphus truei]
MNASFFSIKALFIPLGRDILKMNIPIKPTSTCRWFKWLIALINCFLFKKLVFPGILIIVFIPESLEYLTLGYTPGIPSVTAHREAAYYIKP